MIVQDRKIAGRTNWQRGLGVTLTTRATDLRLGECVEVDETAHNITHNPPAHWRIVSAPRKSVFAGQVTYDVGSTLS